jgi:hypothetical protein
MKYIKRLALNRKNQQDNRFAVEADDRIVTTSKVSFQLPNGASADRPTGVDGMVRYNNTINDPEVYNISGEGTGWEKIKTNRQSSITPQSLGVGNYIDNIFGPLSYDVLTSRPQNVMVFIDNVYQIPVTNYTLVLGTSVSVTADTVGETSTGTSTIFLTTTTNVHVGQTITSSGGIAGATTVTNVNSVTRSVQISNPTIDAIPDSSTCTFSYQQGTFVQFNGAVPAKQVFVLLGIDGYSPYN